MCLRPSPIRAYRARGFSSSSQQPVLLKALMSPMSLLASHEITAHPKKASADVQQSYVFPYDGPVSIAWLPVEILEEIFIWASSVSFHHAPRRYDATRSPLNITHTCHLWREIAIDMPILWNDIFLGPMGLKSLNMLRLWLYRAKDAPLIVCLDQIPGPNDNPYCRGTTQNLECLRYLVAHSSRWHKLRVHNEFLANRELLGLSGQHLQRLQHVVWAARDWYQANEDTRLSFLHFWQVSLDAPVLRKATLSSIPPVAAWDRLVSLHFDCSASADHINVLRGCSNLTELAWTMSDAPDPAPLPPLVHHHIVKLTIQCFSFSGSASRLLNAFTLPSLSELCILEKIARCDFNDIQDMLLRSDAALHSFIFDGNDYIPQHAALSFLRSPEARQLEKLYLPSVQTSGAFWRSLHCEEASALILPQLSELGIGLDKSWVTSCQGIFSGLTFFSTRSSGAADLRVTIYLPLSFDAYDELCDLNPDMVALGFGAVAQRFVKHPIYDLPTLPGVRLTVYDQIPLA